jgi:hypothetical protein
MRKASIVTALALVAGVLLLTPATAGAATTLVVSAVNAQGWTPQHASCSGGVSTGAQAFVSGPATPPLGAGSYQLSIGTDGWSFEALRLAVPAGTSLQDLTRLSYSTYVTAPVAAPYLLINLDLDGDGVTDDQLIWEPYYQATVTPGAWQRWDAIGSLWWSPYADPTGWAGQQHPVTLAEYLAVVSPTADVPVIGGIRVVAGCGWGNSNFVGNFDAFTIGVSGTDTTYDFEPFAPFNGFFQPVDNLPTWNKAKAGQAIPVKFSLGGDAGLSIFNDGFPKLVTASCPAPKTPLDAIETYAAAGSGSLTYDPLSDQYNYVLKTTKGLASTCWTFDLGLKDGSSHTFLVEFVK